jgi:hypothetical protein
VRPTSSVLQTLGDWLVVSLGAFAGILVLVEVGFRIEVGTEFSVACRVAFIGFVLLFASFAAIPSRRIAAFLFLVAIPAAELFVWWPDRGPRNEALIAALAVLAALGGPGIFWLTTHRLGWSPVWNPRLVSWERRIAALVCATFLPYIIISIGVISMFVRLQAIGDCSGYDPPFVKQRSPTEAVFIAKITLLGYPRGYIGGSKASGWALASVQRQFWGLPSRNSSFVILTQYLFQGEEWYFVAGQRTGGFWTLGLPIVEFGPCGRSARLNNAEVELRVLQDGPPKDGVRIIGRVMRYTHTPYSRQQTVPGVNVMIAGPTASVTVTTDQNGIYDATGLPPGRYSIHTDSYSENWHGYPSCGLPENPTLNSGDVWGCTVRIY